MTRFSLKRTLQFHLASTLEVINHIDQGVAKSNFHIPLRSSQVLLSIGKITNICHQKIPLKKVYQGETVTYISAIPLKLAQSQQQSVGEIASVLLLVLRQHIPQPVWASLSQTQQGWLEFVIAQRGIQQWQQQLNQGKLPVLAQTPYPICWETLWQLQSGYELCCRWQLCYRQLGPPISARQQAPPTEPLLLSFYPLQEMAHCLLDICDLWEEAKPAQLLHLARRLVVALEICANATRPASPEASLVIGWFESTQIVLKQLLHSRLGYPLAEQI